MGSAGRRKGEHAGDINVLFGVASSSGTNSFAVGYSDEKTLALRCAC